MSHFFQSLAVPALVSLLTFSSATAGEPDAMTSVSISPVEGDGWQFTLQPYLFFPALNGEVGFGGVVADVDMSFSDIWDAMEFGVMGGFELRKGKWGLTFDGLWLQLEDGGDLPGGFLDELNVEVEEARVQAMISYRIYEDGGTRVDVLGGLSWHYVGLDFDVRTGPRLPNLSGGNSEGWCDPVIGLIIRQSITDNWFVQFDGFIGGFGVGSDFTWQTSAMAGYDINECFTIAAGLRYMSTDYKDGGFQFDRVDFGPFVGCGIYF